MATIHIPESEAIADFGALLDHVRHGEEVVILNGAKSVAVLRSPAPQRRSISESIAMAEAFSGELGYKPVMGPDFAADMEEIVRSRKPADRSAWDEPQD